LMTTNGLAVIFDNGKAAAPWGLVGYEIGH